MFDAVGDLNKSVARDVLSSPARVVEWIDETMAAFRIDTTALVGASLGAWMAARYAMARAARVDRLALVCPAGLVSPQHARWLVTAILSAGVRPTRTRLAAFLDSMAMPSTAPRLREDPWRPVVKQFVDGTISYRSRLNEPRPVPAKLDALDQSTIPVLVIIGADESLHDGPTVAARFTDQVRHAQVELLDEANHLIFIDQQEQVETLLRQFLATDRGGTSNNV